MPYQGQIISDVQKPLEKHLIALPSGTGKSAKLDGDRFSVQVREGLSLSLGAHPDAGCPGAELCSGVAAGRAAERSVAARRRQGEVGSDRSECASGRLPAPLIADGLRIMSLSYT